MRVGGRGGRGRGGRGGRGGGGGAWWAGGEGISGGLAAGLRAMVEDKLELCWSPEQIAGWLRRRFPTGTVMHVSHETIYRSLFVQARGDLRHELTQHLRTGRAMRRPKGTRLPD